MSTRASDRQSRSMRRRSERCWQRCSRGDLCSSIRSKVGLACDAHCPPAMRSVRRHHSALVVIIWVIGESAVRARSYPDVWRRLHPEQTGVYTVWDEKTSARAFNEVRNHFAGDCGSQHSQAVRPPV